MSQTARAKLTVAYVTVYPYGGRDIHMVTQYDETLAAEDRGFSKATPSGEMQMRLENEALYDFFKPGAVFYVDFTPVESDG